MVSPQFHCRYDNSFHTVRQEKQTSLWKLKSGFVTNSVPTDRHEVTKTQSHTDAKPNSSTKEEGISKLNADKGQS